jgi:hypothetical protein
VNRRLLSLIVLLTALVIVPAFAQKKEKEKPNERSVSGMVLDKADNPLEGAVVQLKDMKTLQIRSFITRADGRYRFNGISTEVDYELRATLKGKASNTRTLSTFDSRKAPSMTLKIEQ